MDSTTLIQQLLSRPIAYHRVFARIAGGVAAGVFLSQAYYWSQRAADGEDGWFYKTRHEWQAETELSEREIDDARKRLKTAGVLHEKRIGLPAKIFYKLDLAALFAAVTGATKSLEASEILAAFRREIAQTGKSMMMRARKSDPHCKYVDYAGLFERADGMCGICGGKITNGPGAADDDLTFDYIEEKPNGHLHSPENIQPAHVRCQRDKLNEIQFLYPKETGLVSVRNQDSFGVRKQESLPEGNCSPYRKETFKGTESTTETTTGKTHTARAREPKKFARNVLQEVHPEKNPEQFAPPSAAVSSEEIRKCRDGLRLRLKAPKTLPNADAWNRLFRMWTENESSAENLLKTFDILAEIRAVKKQTWLITPAVIERQFGRLRDLQTELAQAREKMSKPTAAPKKHPENRGWIAVGAPSEGAAFEQLPEPFEKPETMPDSQRGGVLAMFRGMVRDGATIESLHSMRDFYTDDDWAWLIENLEEKYEKEN